MVKSMDIVEYNPLLGDDNENKITLKNIERIIEGGIMTFIEVKEMFMKRFKTVKEIYRNESKKGILDIENADATATSLYIYLKNDEITADRTKFYIQLSVYTTNSAVTPIAIGRGISTDEFLIEIKNLDSAAAWTNLYLYYELVKID
jgi:hypothetical protein